MIGFVDNSTGQVNEFELNTQPTPEWKNMLNSGVIYYGCQEGCWNSENAPSIKFILTLIRTVVP
jgi:hypothetical protein